MDRFVVASFLIVLLRSVLVGAEISEIRTGSCGDLTYTFNETSRVFTLSGTGDMTAKCPIFYPKTIIIEDGITSIIDGAFEH